MTRRLDARSLRALAHPMRLRLLALLRAEGPATATQLAARVGETSGTTSWHLRQLADHDLIEEDSTRGNRRERWWRSAQDSLEVPEEDFVPEHTDALAVYLHDVVTTNLHRASAFVAELGDWRREWLRAADLSSAPLRLTADELRELNDEIRAAVERRRRPARPGAEEVMVQWQSFPRRIPRATDD